MNAKRAAAMVATEHRYIVRVLVELTELCTTYVSDRVSKRDSSVSKQRLDDFFQARVPELVGIDTHEFAIYLVMYLFENRRR